MEEIKEAPIDVESTQRKVKESEVKEEIIAKPKSRKEFFKSFKQDYKPEKSSFFELEGGQPEPEEAWFLFIDDYHTRVDDITQVLKEERENVYLLLYQSV